MTRGDVDQAPRQGYWVVDLVNTRVTQNDGSFCGEEDPKPVSSNIFNKLGKFPQGRRTGRVQCQEPEKFS